MEYQRCHAIGHRWENIPVTHPPAFGAAMDLRCENCATVRRDIISRISGVLITRYYVYPDAYHDYERHDKAWWRSSFVESLERAAREYINAINEQTTLQGIDLKRAARQAKREWVAAVTPIAQSDPPNPSPAPATTSRQTTRRVKRNAG